MKHRALPVLLIGLAAGCNTSESCDCVTPPDHDIRITENAASRGPNAFAPPSFTISLADTTMVTWLNRDFSGTGPYGGNGGIAHHIVSDDGTTFDSGNLPPNGTFTATLSAPATYGYHCSIHPAMTGTLTVNP